jgi:hypothetical protein
MPCSIFLWGAIFIPAVYLTPLFYFLAGDPDKQLMTSSTFAVVQRVRRRQAPQVRGAILPLYC